MRHSKALAAADLPSTYPGAVHTHWLRVAPQSTDEFTTDRRDITHSSPPLSRPAWVLALFVSRGSERVTPTISYSLNQVSLR